MGRWRWHGRLATRRTGSWRPQTEDYTVRVWLRTSSLGAPTDRCTWRTISASLSWVASRVRRTGTVWSADASLVDLQPTRCLRRRSRGSVEHRRHASPASEHEGRARRCPCLPTAPRHRWRLPTRRALIPFSQSAVSPVAKAPHRLASSWRISEARSTFCSIGRRSFAPVPSGFPVSRGNPHRTLPEVRIELPPRLRHLASPLQWRCLPATRGKPTPPPGQRVAVFYTKVHGRLLRPLIAADLTGPSTSDEHSLPSTDTSTATSTTPASERPPESSRR